MANKTGKGGWKKGQSGNPGGRKKIAPEIRELAKAASPEAIATLVSVMQNEEAPAAARVSAADKILDRAYGKPEQTSNVNVRNKQSARDYDRQELIAYLSSQGIIGQGSSEREADCVH